MNCESPNSRIQHCKKSVLVFLYKYFKLFGELLSLSAWYFSIAIPTLWKECNYFYNRPYL